MHADADVITRITTQQMDDLMCDLAGGVSRTIFVKGRRGSTLKIVVQKIERGEGRRLIITGEFDTSDGKGFYKGWKSSDTDGDFIGLSIDDFAQ